MKRHHGMTQEITTAERTAEPIGRDRGRAIEDGVLVDVTEYARQLGLRYPTAFTLRAYQAAGYQPGDPDHWEWDNAIVDCLTDLADAIRARPVAGGRAVLFRFSFYDDDCKLVWGTLKAVYETDDGRRCVTVGFPEEF